MKETAPIYDWETAAPPLRCPDPECGQTANPLSGGKRYECFGCGDRWRVGSVKHAAAVERTKREGQP